VNVNQRSILLGVAALGCTHYANWHDFARSPGYHVPASIPIVVERTDAVRAADEGGFVDTTVLTVENDLLEKGIEGHIVEASAHPPAPPRVELSFTGWTEGSGAARYFSEGLLGEAQVVVQVKALFPDGRVALQGRVAGAEIASSGSARNAAEAAGHSIAKVLADAQYVPNPPHSSQEHVP
jgi:hypothetical protein